MRRRGGPILWLLVATALVASCSGRSPAEARSFASYAKAALLPGVGLGDLRVGETTLGAQIKRFGPGQSAFLIGDEAAVELTYLGGELSLLFAFTGACAQQMGGRGPARRDMENGVAGLLERFPACREQPLGSLAISTGRSRQDRQFFKGATPQGLRLWAPLDDLKKQGVPIQVQQATLRARGYSRKPLTCTDYLEGLSACYPDPRGAGPTAREMRSGRPLSPERLQQLEESARAARKDATVQRLVVFPPSR